MRRFCILIFSLLGIYNAYAQVDSLSVVADTLALPSGSDIGFTMFARGNGAPVDTLDVGDRRVRIVLRDDNTWYLIKNVEALENDELFTTYWSEHVVNPYTKEPFDSIHYRTTICLVDSVSSFVCPHKGKVFSKFGIRHGRPHTGCGPRSADRPRTRGSPCPCSSRG